MRRKVAIIAQKKALNAHTCAYRGLHHHSLRQDPKGFNAFRAVTGIYGEKPLGSRNPLLLRGFVTVRALRVGVSGVILREFRRVQRTGRMARRACTGRVVRWNRRNVGTAAAVSAICIFFVCQTRLMTRSALRVGIVLVLVRLRHLRETGCACVVTAKTLRASGNFMRDARRLARLRVVPFGRNAGNVT